MKLYLVRCRGMQHSSLGRGTGHGTAYVVADNAGAAYEMVLNGLRKRNLGHESEREMETVTLLAETENYPDCGTTLYLPTGDSQ